MIITAESELNREQMIFVASLERYLQAEILKCSKRHDSLLNRPMLEDLKNTILTCFNNIFPRSNVKLSQKTIEWIALEYFKHVTINNQKLGEMLIVSQSSPKDLPESDVEALKKLFSDTEIEAALLNK
jgi:hypothetical protein